MCSSKRSQGRAYPWGNCWRGDDEKATKSTIYLPLRRDKTCIIRKKIRANRKSTCCLDWNTVYMKNINYNLSFTLWKHPPSLCV